MTHPTTSRRAWLCAAASAAALCGLSPAQAQPAWPSKPIRMVVPFAAGGATDVLARVFIDRLQQRLGQTFTAENRGGAGGQIAAAEYSRRTCVRNHIVRLQLVIAFLAGDQQLAEIAVNAVIPEKVGCKLRRRGHKVVSLRPINRQGTFAVLKPRRLDQRREIPAVIDVKVGEQNHVELRHPRPALSEA